MIILQNQITNKNFDKKIKEIGLFLLNKFNKKSELIIVLTDKKTIIELNNSYRKINKATNVLSFPSDVPVEVADILGDIIICLEVIIAEASQQQKTTENHLIHMVVHGFLHLLGYDHINDKEAIIMEKLEVNILQELAINNPYL